MQNKIHVLNIQCSIGQPHKGVVISNKQIKDLFPSNIQKNIDIQQIPKQVFEKSSSLLYIINKCIEFQEKYRSPIFFGGDHYASFFTVLSSLVIYGNNFRLIWLDAHGDIHNMRTSPSGNKHGMPVRFLMEHTIPGIPQLKPNQILYIGLRDLEREEWSYINRHKIKYIRSNDLSGSNLPPRYDQSDIKNIIRFSKGKNIHISLDVDVLDPMIMASTGTLAEGGLSMNMFKYIYNIISQNGNIIAFDIMEYNPSLGNKEEKKTAKNTISQIVNYLYS